MGLGASALDPSLFLTRPVLTAHTRPRTSALGHSKDKVFLYSQIIWLKEASNLESLTEI